MEISLQKMKEEALAREERREQDLREYEKLTIIEKATKDALLAVGTSSPGDGVTRYRFFHQKAYDEIHASYNQGKGLHTALGRKAALDFLSAYMLGKDNAEGSPSHDTTWLGDVCRCGANRD